MPWIVAKTDPSACSYNRLNRTDRSTGNQMADNFERLCCKNRYYLDEKRPFVSAKHYPRAGERCSRGSAAILLVKKVQGVAVAATQLVPAFKALSALWDGQAA